MKTKHKIISGTLALLLALNVTPQLCAAAADASDVKQLSSSLLTGEKLTEAQDLNADKVINAVDLTLMKRALLEGADGALTKHTVQANADTSKLIGRTLISDGITWLPQSGSAVECTVTGTEASVTIAGDGHVFSNEQYRPRYGVYVDGELVKDVVMNEKEQVVPLFSGTEQRTATVKVMHLSEAMNGAVGVRQFDVTSTKEKPVRPTAKKALSIEFIGDSITCAYGVGASDASQSFSTATEDFSKSYAYLTAELLDADYSVVGYSGYGIVSGYTSSGEINQSSLVPPVYEQVSKLSDYAVQWDFAAHPNDVVVLNLGTNDDTYCKQDLDARGAEYQKKYLAFLGKIRECNPDALVICTVGIMGCEEMYPFLEAAVKEFADEKVICYLSPTQNGQVDGLGADWHPSAKTHQQNAALLADKIAQALGIPYARIGVDFAADAVYGADVDDTNGASAWPYYAEWNKSLNVNISAGGTAPEEITAYVRNLVLPKGSYALSFDIKGAENKKIACIVQSIEDDRFRRVMEGEMKIAGSPASFSFPFDVSTVNADREYEVLFLLGDIGSANLTFENLKVTKTQ